MWDKFLDSQFMHFIYVVLGLGMMGFIAWIFACMINTSIYLIAKFAVRIFTKKELGFNGKTMSISTIPTTLILMLIVGLKQYYM